MISGTRKYILRITNDYTESIVRMVGGMRSDEPSDNGLMYPVEALHKSYNQALDDIINKLEER